jgi:hypothetical protein
MNVLETSIRDKPQREYTPTLIETQMIKYAVRLKYTNANCRHELVTFNCNCNFNLTPILVKTCEFLIKRDMVPY